MRDPNRRSRWPLWLFGLSATGLPIAAFVYIVSVPSAADALQRVGGLFLSWPYITVALVLTFFLVFRDPLAAAIGRVHKVKGLGGEVELQVQPPAKPEGPTATDKEARAEEIEAQVTAQIIPESTEATPVQFPEEVLNVLRFIGEPVPHIQTMQDAAEFAGRMLANATFAKEDAQRGSSTTFRIF